MKTGSRRFPVKVFRQARVGDVSRKNPLASKHRSVGPATPLVLVRWTRNYRSSGGLGESDSGLVLDRGNAP